MESFGVFHESEFWQKVTQNRQGKMFDTAVYNSSKLWLETVFAAVLELKSYAALMFKC